MSHEFLMFEVVTADNPTWVGCRLSHTDLRKLPPNVNITVRPYNSWSNEGLAHFRKGFKSVSYKDRLSEPWLWGLGMPALSEWFRPDMHPYDAGVQWGRKTIEEDW